MKSPSPASSIASSCGVDCWRTKVHLANSDKRLWANPAGGPAVVSLTEVSREHNFFCNNKQQFCLKSSAHSWYSFNLTHQISLNCVSAGACLHWLFSKEFFQRREKNNGLSGVTSHPIRDPSRVVIFLSGIGGRISKELLCLFEVCTERRTAVGYLLSRGILRQSFHQSPFHKGNFRAS